MDKAMYFEDLTDYSYSRDRNENRKVLNVGWLDIEKPYNKGTVSEKYLMKLGKFYLLPRVKQTRGYHGCQYCDTMIVNCQILNTAQSLGTAQIWVQASNGTIYACPDMIYHYIVKHDYLPPQEFLDALETGIKAELPYEDELMKNLLEKSKLMEEAKREGDKPSLLKKISSIFTKKG